MRRSARITLVAHRRVRRAEIILRAHSPCGALNQLTAADALAIFEGKRGSRDFRKIVAGLDFRFSYAGLSRIFRNDAHFVAIATFPGHQSLSKIVSGRLHCSIDERPRASTANYLPFFRGGHRRVSSFSTDEDFRD